jgi:hypothetical protein
MSNHEMDRDATGRECSPVVMMKAVQGTGQQQRHLYADTGKVIAVTSNGDDMPETTYDGHAATKGNVNMSHSSMVWDPGIISADQRGTVSNGNWSKIGYMIGTLTGAMVWIFMMINMMIDCMARGLMRWIVMILYANMGMNTDQIDQRIDVLGMNTNVMGMILECIGLQWMVISDYTLDDSMIGRVVNLGGTEIYCRCVRSDAAIAAEWCGMIDDVIWVFDPGIGIVIRCIFGNALIEDAIELQLKSVTAMRNSDETTARKARLNNDCGQVESVDDAENGEKYRQKESKSSRQGCVGYGAVMAMRVFLPQRLD